MCIRDSVYRISISRKGKFSTIIIIKATYGYIINQDFKLIVDSGINNNSLNINLIKVIAWIGDGPIVITNEIELFKTNFAYFGARIWRVYGNTGTAISCD